MFTIVAIAVGSVVFAVCAFFLGGLLDGLDRKLSARMQGRVGPKLRQPFWDVRKLWRKERASTNPVEGVYVGCSLFFLAVAGGVFFAGSNLLLCIVLSTLSELFFVMAAYSARSPFSDVGASREVVQVLAYEPMEYFMAVAVYMALGTFDVVAVGTTGTPLLLSCWPVFLGMALSMLVKLRKSPFDVASGHAAHQEIMQGPTTEMSGRTLAKTKVMHWYETVLMLGWTGMFFMSAAPWGLALAVAAALLVWFADVWVDNNFARVRWQSMLRWCWGTAFVAATANLVVLQLA